MPVDVYRIDDGGDDGGPGGRARYRYSRNGRPGFDGTLGGVLNYALWDVHAFVAQWARDFLFLHAGVAARAGRALLLPATRDTGKTTLTAALVAAGFDYMSDELGPIDPLTGRVYPFPKQMSMDHSSLGFFPGLAERLEDGHELAWGLRQRYVRPEDLGGSTGAAAPVGWVVLPTTERTGPARLTPIEGAEAVRAMASNCFNLYRYRDRGVVLLARVTRAARCFRLEGGDPIERAEVLAAELT